MKANQPRNGPSEFTITGTLKTWSIIDRIPLIKVPTLVINGIYDDAQDIVVKPFVQGIRNVEWVKMQRSSHMSHFEEPARYLAVVHTSGDHRISPGASHAIFPEMYIGVHSTIVH